MDTQQPVSDVVTLKFDATKLTGADWMIILDVAALVEAKNAGEDVVIPARLMQKYYKMVERCLIGGMEQVPFDDITGLSLQFMAMVNSRTNPTDTSGKN